MTRHDSQRGWFAYELYQHMQKDKNIWLICLDLGYKVFDQHFKDFPERCINPGAAEQAGMGIAVGLALEGKIPVVYTISTFLVWRPAETIRLYINHEKIKVILAGSGVKRSYKHDGISHWADDVPGLLNLWPNIQQYWPEKKEDIIQMLKDMLQSDSPSFIGLKR